MSFLMSSMVTTCSTPGSFFAALVSTDLIRPWATVLRNILATSMPGSRMLWTYSARPVTLSRPSVRGTERPIWDPALAVAGVSGVAISASAAIQCCAHGPLDIDSHELALIGSRAAHVGDELHLLNSGVGRAPEQLVVDPAALQNRLGRRQPNRFLGRGARDDASRCNCAGVSRDHGGDAERRPIVD